MALEYYVTPYHLKPGTWKAEVVPAGTVTLEDIFEYMTEEGSTVTTAEALANFELFASGIEYFLSRGYAVKTPLANFRPGIEGTFTGEDDTFDPDRHMKKVNAHPNVRLKRAALEMPVWKTASRHPRPRPEVYHDTHSDTKNQVITPGRGACIRGSKLAFDEQDTEQGIFFIHTADRSAIRVEGRMMMNMPGQLIFMNPDLPAGTYRVEVRSILKNGSEIRTGTLYDKLTVAGERS